MFDTRTVPPRHRICFWEEKCADKVVGLRCSSLEPEGLQARFHYADLGAIKMIDISGRQHVVERTPNLVRTIEKNSVFLILMVRGKAFVNRANDCVVLDEGDCVLYDTTRPYMHGFPGDMRHVIFEVAGEEFRTRFPNWKLTEAYRFDASLGAGRHVSSALRQILTRHNPFSGIGAPGPVVEEEVWNTLEVAHSLTQGEQRTSYHALMMQRIKQFMLARLCDPELSPTLIADETGISVRHLNRLFAGEPRSLSDTIMSVRLQRCREDLLKRDSLGTSVSEIAYHWGFKNLAHFSRKFHEEFGCAPSKIRLDDGCGPPERTPQ
jgi:AraC-like DNA-binding protein